MKVSKILMLALVLYIAQVLSVALTTYFFGVPEIDDLGLAYWFAVKYGPSSLVSTIAFILIAKYQEYKPFINALCIYVLSEIYGIVILSVMLKSISYSSNWIFEVPISLATLLIGTAIGVRLRTKKMDAQWEQAPDTANE